MLPPYQNRCMESTTIPNHHSRSDIGTSINTTNSNPPANPNSSKSEIITTTSHIPPPAPNPRAKPTSPSSITSSITSPPPYWSHNRPISQVSIESIDPSGITLQDNTAEGDDGDVHGVARGKNEACWARSVVIDDYVVVNGSGRMGSGMGISNIGAFVVWNVRVDTLEVCVSFLLRPSRTPERYTNDACPKIIWI